VPQLEAALRAAGRAVQVVDAGVSGDTSAGGARRIEWSLATTPGQAAPQAAIVELGANDGLRGLAPRQTRANLERILDQLAARQLPVLLAGMQAPPNLGADYGREFAAVFSAIAAARPQLVFYPFFLEGVAGDPALNQADRIHPNPEGVRRIVRRLLPAVLTLLDKLPPAQSPAG
jgi:acyl-CoA thioesterase-1